MKKSFLLTLASSALLLCACGSSPSISSPSSDSTTSESSTVSTPAIDFSLVSSCKAGSIEKESFTITTPNPGEEYSSWDDPVIEIAINQANWAYVTAIKEEDKSILSQEEGVVPSKAITLETIDSTSGTGGSNVISRIDLHIDRSQVKTGTTRIKTRITPSNGVSSASKIELCFELNVVPFGSISVETTEVPFEIDLSAVKNAAGKHLEFNISDMDYEYGSSHVSYYGFTTNGSSKIVDTMSLALGHVYSFSVTVGESAPYVFYDVSTSSSSLEKVDTNHYRVKEAISSTVYFVAMERA